MLTVELVMTETGISRHTAGRAPLSRTRRLEPTLSSFRRHFPQAQVTLYTDSVKVRDPDIRVVQVESPLDESHARHGWRFHDYFQVAGLLRSRCDVAIAMDSDMRIVSPRVTALVPMTLRFGACAPASPRLLVRIDGTVGKDIDGYSPAEDESGGDGLCHNMTPLSLATRHREARALLEAFLHQMETDPIRGPVALWRASWQTGFSLQTLPFQWCVCARHTGCGDEIILHVGHPDVARHYGIEGGDLPG